jgi:glycosyltransferase involved in cell wall biosynthesis
VVADRYREDLQRAGIGDGNHSFALALPHGLASDVRHVIELYGAADWTLLEGSPAVLEPVAAPPLVPLGELHGYLDVASPARIAGWAQDAADPERAVGLVIRANGQVIHRVLANRHRADLAAAGIGSGRHGFELSMPDALSPLVAQEISITREADGAELPGSPRILPAANGLEAALDQNLAGLFARVGVADEELALAFLAEQADRLLARRAARQGGRAVREAHRLHRRRWAGAGGEDAAPPEALGLHALVVDDIAPCASRDAGSVAILSHMRALRTLGYAVSFVAANEPGDSAALQALGAEGIAACGAPYYSCVEDVLSRQAATFDLIYLHRMANADRYLSLARRYNPNARIVYSVADLHHLRLQRQAKVEARPELLALSRRMAASELLAARRADLVITHSPVEAELLRREVGFGKVHVVPFAVPRRAPRRPFAERHGIAIVGSFAHAPNPDAVHHLVHDILPLVWKEDPALTCKVVGHGWTKDRLPGLDKRVEMVGAVADLDEVFDTVRLTVAPLRFGAGIKGKVLDSFAAGLPCVMTPIAAEGLPLPETLQDLVGHDPAAIAQRILRYHDHPAVNEIAGTAGADIVAQQFGADSVAQAMDAALNSQHFRRGHSARSLTASPGHPHLGPVKSGEGRSPEPETLHIRCTSISAAQ